MTDVGLEVGYLGLRLGKSLHALNLCFLSNERTELNQEESSPDSGALGF